MRFSGKCVKQDSFSSRYIDSITRLILILKNSYVLGEKTISLLTTGHEKQSVTVILAATADGKKKKPFIVLQGKGRAKDIKELKNRRDIDLGFSINGWANDEIIHEWINKNFGTISFQKRLLIWDSFRAHMSENTKKILKQKRIDQAIIPAGCTGIVQAPDVVWNKPFKVSFFSKKNCPTSAS